MMELKEGMSVVTPGSEEVGKITRFVLDPETNEVTHIVIQKGWLLPEDKVVPFHMVSTSTEEQVVLSEDVGDLDQLPPFEERQFIQATEDDLIGSPTTHDPALRYTPAYYWYPGHPGVGYPGMRYFALPPVETKRNIPDDTIPLEEGTDVISSDGEHVGDVERLIVEPESNKATHFVISQGLLFKDRKLVPAHWVKSVEEEKVYLMVSSRLLERLPAYDE